jgi:LemA protein
MKFIILLILASLSGYAIFIYFRINAQVKATKDSYKKIDAPLEKRYGLLESLSNTLSNHPDYAHTNLEKVITLRNNAVTTHANGDEIHRRFAENQISIIISELNSIFEKYPDLKKDAYATELHKTIIRSESNLAFLREEYNNHVESYRSCKKIFLADVIVSTFKNSLDINFSIWPLPDPRKGKGEAPTLTVNYSKLMR